MRTITETVRLERWTPAKARTARKNPSRGQRDIKAENVGLFRLLIQRDRWFPTVGAPLSFMTDGTLGNGNNRAEAIAGLPRDHPAVPVLVARNVPMEALPHFDTGQTRSLANHLGYALPKHALLQTMASMSSVVMAYNGPPNPPRVDRRQDTVEAIDHILSNLSRYEEAAKLARDVAREDSCMEGGVATPRTLGWLLYYTLDHPDSAEFWTRYAGRQFDAKDPRHAMTSHYAKNPIPKGAMARTVTLDRIANMAACWDSHLNGGKWKPWDGKIATFRHPTPPHPPRQKAA
jgi:hypothetical protein